MVLTDAPLLRDVTVAKVSMKPEKPVRNVTTNVILVPKPENVPNVPEKELEKTVNVQPNISKPLTRPANHVKMIVLLVKMMTNVLNVKKENT